MNTHYELVMSAPAKRADVLYSNQNKSLVKSFLAKLLSEFAEAGESHLCNDLEIVTIHKR